MCPPDTLKLYPRMLSECDRTHCWNAELHREKLNGYGVSSSCLFQVFEYLQIVLTRCITSLSCMKIWLLTLLGKGLHTPCNSFGECRMLFSTVNNIWFRVWQWP
jgi:hypothetical protein